MEEAVKKPIVTVIAGAGYGKSHAVHSFVHKHPVNLVWMGLTGRDNIGDRFWEDFTTALGVFNKKSADALTEIGFPSTDRKFDRYLRIPVEDVVSGEPYIFVYDDFHLLRSKNVLWFMEKSITTPFPNITSILISRTGIPLNLMGFESRGLLAAITQEDLKFSKEEMLDYFALRDIQVRDKIADDIYADSEGWTFAIRLAGEVIIRSRSKGLDEYSHMAFRTNIFKLIEKEIVSTASPRLRNFLIKAALIDVQQADLMEEIGGPELINELSQFGSFINLDTYTNVYNIHPLLLEYLQGLKEELSGEEQNEVYLKAARWCFERGKKLNAIAYHDKAGDYSGLFKLLYTIPLIFRDHVAEMLLEMVLRSPPGVYEENPAAYVIRTRLFIILTRFEEAEREIKEFISRLEVRNDARKDPRIARALAGLYNNQGLMKNLRCQITRDYSFVEDLEKAAEYFKISRFTPGPPTSIYNVSSYLCRVGIPDRGEMEKYIHSLSAAVDYVAVTIGGCAYGMDDLAQAELAFYRGELSTAEEWAYKSITKARQQFQYEVENRALFFLLRISLSRGDAAAIKDVFKELEAQLSEVNYLNRLTYYDIVCGWFYVQIGELDKVASWLKSNFEESELNSIVHGQEILIKAMYHLAAREYPVALATLQNRNDQFGLNAFLLGKIETKILEAICRYKNRNRKESFATLEEAWTLAEPNGFIMPFTEMGRDMRTLSAAAMDSSICGISREVLEKIHTTSSAYAKRLALVENEFQEGTRKRGACGVLSPRERKTLKSLYHGLTGEEIAQEGKLSINTVKSITKRIYNKLGAINKADAIRIALENGLLGPDMP
jgi:LuxR family maltose regulon positive regulatory protein